MPPRRPGTLTGRTHRRMEGAISMLDLSVIAPVRDAEEVVVAMVREAADLVRTMGGVGALAEPASFEVLAVDERSGDNTLALLSLLHGQVPELRTFQDVEPGTAIARATRVAQGQIWLMLDRPVASEWMRWTIEQVACGRRAALVPGETLAVERNLGAAALARLNGGLVCAQRVVTRKLARRGERPVVNSGPERGLVDRSLLRLRGALGSLGLGVLDRPPKATEAKGTD